MITQRGMRFLVPTTFRQSPIKNKTTIRPPLSFRPSRLPPRLTTLPAPYHHLSPRHQAPPPPSLLHSRAFHSTPPIFSTPPAPSPTVPTALNPSSSSDPPPNPTPTPSYQLTFTCKPCTHRSTHRISQHGYHKGTVLVTCPQCGNRHVVSDHLKIFSDERVTLEEIMKSRGELVRRGRVSESGDVEFWDGDKDKVDDGGEKGADGEIKAQE